MQLWRGIQFLAIGLALLLIYILFSLESLGLRLFWGGLITLAPLLLLLVPTLWRNICPLGITSMLPNLFRFSLNRKMSSHLQNTLMAIGLALLILLPPLRPAFFDNSGINTGLFLLAWGAIAFALGLFFEGKSAFCNGLCPVLWVEGLYGQNTVHQFKNSLCDPCSNCTKICLDINKDETIESMQANPQSHRITEWFIGAFPGYVFGWFQLKAPVPGEGLSFIFAQAYLIPIGCMLISLAIYFGLKKFALPSMQPIIRKIFAGLAISFYYWYRIPAMFGFGENPRNALFNLDGVLHSNEINLIRISIIMICFLLLLVKKPNKVKSLSRLC